MNIVFEDNFPNYNLYVNYIKIKTYLYKRKINRLKKKYKIILKKYDMKKYNVILQKKKKHEIKIIYQTIKLFKKLTKNSIIFLHGSISKSMNRWNSDIDLNILYDDIEDHFVVEELISVALYKIMGYVGRDKIHTMMLYIPHNIDSEKYKYCNKSSIIFKNDNNKKYCYSYRVNYDKIFHKITNSSRNINDFKNYVLNSDNTNEWEYSFKPLNKYSKNILDKILEEKNKMINNEALYKNLFSFMKSNKHKLDLNHIKRMSDFNRKIKTENLRTIYSFLLCLKQLIIIEGGICNYLDINEIIDNKVLCKFFTNCKLKNIKNFIFKSLWILDRIENLLVENKINFSSRNEEKFDIDIFSKIYAKEYDTDFFYDIEVFNEFECEANNMLERIIDNYE